MLILKISCNSYKAGISAISIIFIKNSYLLSKNILIFIKTITLKNNKI